MEHVVRTLSDPLAVRQRRAALETLGAVCSSIGYLVDPEYEHPKLVDLITKVLTGEKNLETRREAMRVGVSTFCYLKVIEFKNRRWGSSELLTSTSMR
jgi:hypothetical protein